MVGIVSIPHHRRFLPETFPFWKATRLRHLPGAAAFLLLSG
jgi:hypothetical protein